MRLPCPFFSLQVALLCMCTLMAVVCLFAGEGLGLVQPASQSGMGTALIPPHGCLVRPKSSALGSHGRGSSSVQGLGGVGAVSGRELRSPGTFLSLCLDGNSYLGLMTTELIPINVAFCQMACCNQDNDTKKSFSTIISWCSLISARKFLLRNTSRDFNHSFSKIKSYSLEVF